jgi:transposase-like protein
MTFDLTNPIYSNADLAREELESILWPNGPVCPKCGETERLTRLAGKTTRPGLVMCNACRKPFTVTVGTVFEDSKIPLNKWLLGFRLMAASKKGISAHQLHRSLGITYKSAWFMAHRIREAMQDDGSPLGGEGVTVEADEAFVGGKQSRRAYRVVAPKKMVVALVERGGRARSFHIADITSKTLRGALVTNVDRLSHLRTDGAWAYRRVGPEYASHQYVDHRRAEYGAGDKHSNTAENFFSILKRGVIGTYHHWSQAHIHRYLAEFDFRYSTKDVSDKERTDAMLRGVVGRRLTYRRTGPLFA